MSDYGLTANGFIRKRLPEIKTTLENAFKAKFGNSLNVNPDSMAGIQIGIIAAALDELWELAEGTYNSQYPSSADGISLARGAELVGVVQLGATYTTIIAAALGTEGTVLPIGQIVKVANTSYLFSSTEQITITRLAAIKLKISVNQVLNSTLYTVFINNTKAEITSDSSATAAEIVTALVAALTALSEPITVTNNNDNTFYIESDDLITPFSGAVDSKLTIAETWTNVNFQSQVKGAIVVTEETLTDIQTPINGWSQVTNFIEGSTGRNIETDTALRIRRRDSVRIVGAATDEAIRARLKQQVPGVKEALIFSNRTLTIDIDGRPPKSFEAVVDGGEDADIALKLWQVEPSGIETYGNVTEIVIDSEGNEQVIKFSRAVPVYLWVRITLTLIGDGSLFPDDGAAAIQAAVLAQGATADIGDDVYYETFYCAIFQTPGVASAVIELATSATPEGPPGAYSSANVAINERQRAEFDLSRIEIIE